MKSNGIYYIIYLPPQIKWKKIIICFPIYQLQLQGGSILNQSAEVL